MSAPFIERYFDDQCMIPALRAVGQSRQVVAREGLQPHHEAYYEIHLVMHGVVDWWVEDEVYTLPPGSIYITKPGEVHGGVLNFVQPCTLSWLQVDPLFLDAVGEDIKQDLDQLEERVWPGAHELVGFVDSMLGECRLPKPDSPRMLTAYLILFLAQLLRQYRHRTVQPRVPAQFRNMVEHIEDSLTEGRSLTIQELCQFSGLKRSRIFQLFDQHAGQGPIAYLNTRRIELAKQKLIETETPITDIALALGFSSSQHFATAFKRTTGLSPRVYRQAASQNQTPLRKVLGQRNHKGHE